MDQILFVPVCKRYISSFGNAPLFLFHPVYDCGPLTNPDNGTVQLTLTTFGAIALFSCDEGFNLTGNNGEDYRECLFGGWNGEDPTCESMLKQSSLLCYFIFCCFQLLNELLLK